jgi:CDP-paratose 2-epimerase
MRMGFLQWFPIGDRRLAESAMAELKAMGVTHLRTGFSWADWEDDSRLNPIGVTGREWIAWLYPALKSEGFELLPDFLYTPLHLARPDAAGERRTSHPPQRIEDYVDFLTEAIQLFGDCFDHVEILNEPHLEQEWHVELDPGYELYKELTRLAARRAHELGKKTVLGGIVVHHLEDFLLPRVRENKRFLEDIDVVGIHGFPYCKWGEKHSDKHFSEYAEDFKRALKFACGWTGEIWVTETGFPTQGDPNASEERQAQVFTALTEQEEAARVYWWSLYDLSPDVPSYTESQIGFREEMFYHFGVKTATGEPKLLFKKLAQGAIPLITDRVSEGTPA